MSTSYKLVFIFAIFMIFFTLILGGATKSKSSGVGVLFWGYTAWLMFKHKSEELVHFYKAMFIFDVICAVVASSIFVIYGNDLSSSVGNDLSTLSIIFAITISLVYFLFRYFINQHLFPNNSHSTNFLGFRKVDDKFWELALHEVDSENRNEADWAKAYSKSSGDESKAKSLYIKLRANKLSRNSSFSENISSIKEENKISLSINLILYKRIWISTLLFLGFILIYDISGFTRKSLVNLSKNNSQALVVANEIGGVKLGDVMRDFLFNNAGYIRINSDKSDTYDYFNDVERVLVSFESNKVKSIFYRCKDEYDLSSYNGIGCGDDAQSILKMYKNDVRILCSKNAETKYTKRVYDAIKYGLRYALTNNKVTGFIVAEPEVLSTFVGFNYEACD